MYNGQVLYNGELVSIVGVTDDEKLIIKNKRGSTFEVYEDQVNSNIESVEKYMRYIRSVEK